MVLLAPVQKKRLFLLVFGAGGLGLLAPLLCVMGVVVAFEDPATIPASADAIEGEIISPSLAQGPIGAPFVYGRVRTYATYRRGGRQPYASVDYVNEDRGNPNVTLRTASGDVQVTLRDPMNTWRNTQAEQVSYDSPAEMPGWQRGWRAPERARSFGDYVLAVRTGQRLLVDRATGIVWIGGRAGGEGAIARHRESQRAFSLGSFACAFFFGAVSLVSLILGMRARP